MKLFALTSVSACLALLGLGNAWQSAQAQGYATDNPNMGHFYMARRQITITDEAPAVNDQRTNPQAGGAAGPGMAPGMGRALPKAGWTPYSQFVPGLSTNLPKTANGVPTQPSASADPTGMKGKAGKLKSSKSSAAKPKTASSGPPSIKSYTPYKGYGAPPQMVKGGGNGSVPNFTAGGSVNSSGAGAGYGYGNSQTETNVKGSVLHWARVKRQKLN
ncbi:MAG TPA: hypothetical protein PKZ32_01305 [Candidatus Melainabacteria bacterium]|nr:hypothetical protein [Candidatus Melainabacteria bacterium]